MARADVTRIGVTAGDHGDLLDSAPFEGRIVFRAADGRTLLEAKADRYQSADLKELCRTIGVEADGPDGIWVR